ncbi:MAG: hypothetical protein PVJ34_00985 [Anaerolineae bacterium]|jgi:hypothetical protein
MVSIEGCRYRAYHGDRATISEHEKDLAAVTDSLKHLFRFKAEIGDCELIGVVLTKAWIWRGDLADGLAMIGDDVTVVQETGTIKDIFESRPKGTDVDVL